MEKWTQNNTFVNENPFEESKYFIWLISYANVIYHYKFDINFISIHFKSWCLIKKLKLFYLYTKFFGSKTIKKPLPSPIFHNANISQNINKFHYILQTPKTHFLSKIFLKPKLQIHPPSKSIPSFPKTSPIKYSLPISKNLIHQHMHPSPSISHTNKTFKCYRPEPLHAKARKLLSIRHGRVRPASWWIRRVYVRRRPRWVLQRRVQTLRDSARFNDERARTLKSTVWRNSFEVSTALTV